MGGNPTAVGSRVDGAAADADSEWAPVEDGEVIDQFPEIDASESGDEGGNNGWVDEFAGLDDDEYPDVDPEQRNQEQPRPEQPDAAHTGLSDAEPELPTSDDLTAEQPELRENGHAERGHAEKGHAERGHAERGHVQDGHPEPGNSEPGNSEPGRSEPGRSEPGRSEPGQPEAESFASAGDEPDEPTDSAAEQPQPDQPQPDRDRSEQPQPDQPQLDRDRSEQPQPDQDQPDQDRSEQHRRERPLGSAPLLDSAPLPATMPGMLRPRPVDAFTLPVQRPAFDAGHDTP
jgi:hypothetical protein